ncbi:MAG TPA: hypothetical protein VK173_05830 [Lacibacter sp.]|nr:hypothetical protein [Lacibacter sp.]
MRQWIIDNVFSGKSKFMSFLGAVFVIGYLSITVYQMGNWNIYLSKGKITTEIYERMVTGSLKDLFGIIMMIVAFYFRNDEKTTEIKQQLP